jgi:transcriptional regulator with XRE-family HTH domain
MDGVRFGLAVRALRRRRGWTQAELARRAGVSQGLVSRVERGGAARLTGEVLRRLVAPLGARVVTRLAWHGEDLDRLLDERHAAIVELVVARLTRRHWETAVEVTFNVFGERGSMDILAFHRNTGSLLVVEVKSVVPDLQAMLAALDRKRRLAPALARDHGWTASVTSTLLVLPDEATPRRRVALHDSTFASRFPVRSGEMRAWLASPVGAVGGMLFVTLPRSAGAVRPRSRNPSGSTHATRGTTPGANSPPLSHPGRR